MKYILLIGASNAGKSTSVSEVCKRLHTERIWRLEPSKELLNSSFVEVDINTSIQNGTYLIQVNGDIILVAAGSPTEQNITVTILVSICIKLNIKINILVVSMRSFEKKDGFNTRNELQAIGEKIYEEKIYPIEGQDFKESKQWNERIDKIVDLIRQHQEGVYA